MLMSNLHQYKTFVLVYMFYYTCTLFDILMIHLPSITLNLKKKSDRYPTELQLNGANACHKENHLLNIKVIGDYFDASVYDKCCDF